MKLRRRSVWVTPALGLVWLIAAGCATSLDSALGLDAAPSEGFGPFGSGGSSASPTPPLSPAPEVEIPIDFEQPHAGDHFVYVANPESDRVAVIDATTLAIRTVETGDNPAYLETLNGKDIALVLNLGSSDASIIRTDPSGHSSVSRVELIAGSNTLVSAPDGKHAIAYFDAQKTSVGSTRSFQDVNVISIAQKPTDVDTSLSIAVGFRPSRVFFDQASEHAFIVTEDGVSIIDLRDSAAGGIARTLPVSPLSATKALDVSVTPDGKYALGRSGASSLLYLRNLTTGELQTLDLSGVLANASAGFASAQCTSTAGAAGEAGAGASGIAGSPGMAGSANSPCPPPEGSGGGAGAGAGGPPTFIAEVTDLDLAASGEFAVAVVRNASTAVMLPIPEAFSDAALAQVVPLSGETIGSVTLTPNGKQALLYTTAQATVERLSLLDLSSFEWKSQDLRKIIRSVLVTADSTTAMIVHQKAPGSAQDPGLDPDIVIDRSFGYSLVQLKSGYSKLQTTAADVGSFQVMPDASALFLLVNGPGVHEVERVGLGDFIVTRVALGSPPISLGAVPGAAKAWVGQSHPDGRITFMNFAAQNIESVTGFELNSRVRE